MTPAQLKRKVVAADHDTFFFTRNNMKFAGDTMKNFGVREAVVDLNDGVTKDVKAWELYRKKTTPKGMKGSFFFDTVTFERCRVASHRSAFTD